MVTDLPLGGGARRRLGIYVEWREGWWSGGDAVDYELRVERIGETRSVNRWTGADATVGHSYDDAAYRDLYLRRQRQLRRGRDVVGAAVADADGLHHPLLVDKVRDIAGLYINPPEPRRRGSGNGPSKNSAMLPIMKYTALGATAALEDAEAGTDGRERRAPASNERRRACRKREMAEPQNLEAKRKKTERC